VPNTQNLKGYIVKNLNNKLHTLTTNKVEIHKLAAANTELIKDIFPLLIKEIKALKALPIHKETKKATLAKIVKADLNTAEPIVNTALNLIILGLDINHDLPLGKINQVITLLNKKVITKNWINKATIEQINTKLTATNKAKKLATAKKLVNGITPAKKAANKVTKKTTKKAA